jgi:hypothetical protein
VEIFIAAGLRTFDAESLAGLANEAKAVGLLGVESVDLYGCLDRQVHFRNPEGARDVDPPKEGGLRCILRGVFIFDGLGPRNLKIAFLFMI